MEFKSKLSAARVESNMSDEQLSTIATFSKVFQIDRRAIKFYNDYYKMLQKAGYDKKNRKGVSTASRTPYSICKSKSR